MTNEAERDDMLEVIMKLTSGLKKGVLNLPREIAEIILGHLQGYVLFPGIHTVHRLTVDTGPGDAWHHNAYNLPARYNMRMLQ